jgi:hypothetical protein
MKIRLFRRGLPFLWILTSITLVILYMCYFYTSTPLRSKAVEKKFNAFDQFKQDRYLQKIRIKKSFKKITFRVELTSEERNLLKDVESLWYLSSESSEDLSPKVDKYLSHISSIAMTVKNFIILFFPVVFAQY